MYIIFLLRLKSNMNMNYSHILCRGGGVISYVSLYLRTINWIKMCLCIFLFSLAC